MSEEEKLAKAVTDLVEALQAERARVQLLHTAIDCVLQADDVAEMQGGLIAIAIARRA